ncbi:MAG TPA: pilus assembly protein N-terminal domain-containing protein [Gemmatimonadaceae bacterium]|nr:pilus assembly protein N-terminal domain-containing protein [Gemmatimonadaceae bacterium]
MNLARVVRRFASALVGALLLSLPGALPSALHAQETQIQRIDLPIGRSYPVTTSTSISKVSIGNPEVADVAVVAERDLVINARATGETDAIIWEIGGRRHHFRVQVRSPSDRMQLAVYIKFAEVRRDAIRELGASFLFRDNGTRIGTGIFRSDNVFDDDGNILLPTEAEFLTVLTDFDTDKLLGFLTVEEQKGRAKILAEPNVLAGNRETATFLAGGELPIPVVQGTSADVTGTRVSIEYKKFGIQLRFTGEIVSDELIKLTLVPEVSSLDFGNAIIISGFRVPAFRTRRIETTVDVRRSQSLIISGLFNNEQERVRTGVPLLQDIPILGALFSSTRWQRNESELLVVVTPVVVDPMRPRPQDTVPTKPETQRPAEEALEMRQPSEAPAQQGPQPPPA